MDFYHNIITEKSFKFLRELRKNYNFILIGDWAVFLYSHSLKSKDVDIVVDYEELAKLKENYQVFKNDRLKKYEIKQGEIDVDIYLPHYSNLGIPLENLKDQSASQEGFVTLQLEILTLLKLYAWQERKGTIKGKKDEIDIFSLVILPEFDWQKYLKLVKENNFKKCHDSFINLLKGTREIKELGINEQKMAKIRKKILKVIQ